MRLRAHPTAVDTGVALVLGLIATLSPLPDVAVALTGAGLTLPLALRRRAPLVTFAVVVAAGLVLLFLPGRAVPFGLVGVPVTVHALAAYGPRWAGRAGLAVGLVASVLGAGRFTTIDGGALSPQAVSFSAASIALLVLASWALGHLRRQRLLTEARLVERAQMLELERGQQAQAGGRGRAGAHRPRACTTWSPTPSPWSSPRPTAVGTPPAPTRRPRPPRWRPSASPRGRRCATCGACSACCARAARTSRRSRGSPTCRRCSPTSGPVGCR
ncbi:hypothetical protein GCM10025868_28740 [Angustibacter aerolatus]|uniref:DUF7134 domain-containing protein n=1 Tax=Angustibacter aerolatus TaxID=1162965 RepID=A0ABQ6JJQ5_9ACTN|nr:hypothetical protein GCM10025868_28740 [Angustibacter aerolatus]